MGSSIFWTPGAGPKPWWVPPLIVDDAKPQSELKLDLEKITPTSGKDTFLTKEELEAIENDENLTLIEKALLKRDSEAVERATRLDHAIRCWNADFIREFSEEQQWAFVNTMDSLRNSALRLSNTPWKGNDSICGAVYGQCQAKIQMTSSLLGGKYEDKMQEAFDWFFDNTVVEGRRNFPNTPLYKDNPNFVKFEELFEQLGSSTNAKQFKEQLKTALNELNYSVGNEFAIRPRPGGGTWANFVGFLVNDWNNYFWSLISHGFEDFAAFLHEIDTTA